VWTARWCSQGNRGGRELRVADRHEEAGDVQQVMLRGFDRAFPLRERYARPELRLREGAVGQQLPSRHKQAASSGRVSCCNAVPRNAASAFQGSCGATGAFLMGGCVGCYSTLAKGSC
jgi:hypothetical protein